MTTCMKCGTQKPADAPFFTDGVPPNRGWYSSKDGRSVWCGECIHARLIEVCDQHEGAGRDADSPNHVLPTAQEFEDRGFERRERHFREGR